MLNVRLLHFRLTGLVAALLILGMTPACAKKASSSHTPVVSINAAFVPHVQAFVQAAAQQGQTITITDLIVQFGETPSSGDTGVCVWADDATPTVTINQSIWNTFNSSADEEEDVFHDLGHCLLRRIHDQSRVTGTTSLGTQGSIPQSVMYPVRIDGVTYTDNLATYRAELFSITNQF